MVRGLTEVEKNLNSRGIPMLLLKGLPQDELPKALKTYGASHLVCDFSPLRFGRKWREEVAEATNAFVYEGTSLCPPYQSTALAIGHSRTPRRTLRFTL